MTEARFSLKFDGPAFENGEIDVHDLAPALLALGDLFQEANDLLNENKTKTSVRVNATAQGCFEVDLSLWQDVLDQLFNYALTHRDGIAAADELADLVFKIGAPVIAAGGTGVGGLVWLIKLLKGRKPEKFEDRKDGTVSIHIDHIEFVTNRNTIRLAENRAIREHAKKLVAVLENEGVNSLAVRHGDQDDLTITKRDLPSFEVPALEEEELEDTTRRMNLEIISLSFKEENKWRLSAGKGSEPFSATIEDIDFLNKINSSEVAFGKNDYLVCEVRERQKIAPKGLKLDRTIIRVIEHKQANRQLRLI